MSTRRPGQRRSSKLQKRARRQRLERARRGPQPPGHGHGHDSAEDQDIIAEIERALADPHPLSLLALVSSVLTALTPARTLPFGPAADADAEPRPTLEEFVDSFLGVDIRQTTAALAVIAVLTQDELLAARIRREVDRRTHPLPDWLGSMGDLAPYRAVEMVHVLGDGDDVMVALRLPTGHELTQMVYIDHNMGTLVKDAFFIPDRLDAVIALMQREGDQDDTEYRELDLADARTRVDEASQVTAISYPPIESESWPACRPLVEWVSRRLPAGGSGYRRPEWSDDDIQRLAEDFFASRFGAPLDDRDHRDLLGSILWFGTDYGPGDPLRWSPVAVELLLADWIPRKIVAEAEFLSLTPDLLRAYVGYCHHFRGIRPGLTTETLDAVDHWTPEYLEAIRSPRPQGVDALLAAMGEPWSIEEGEGVADGDDADLLGDPQELLAHLLAEYPQRRLAELAAAVGGPEVLDTLDTVPLPDEGFDWAGIPDDIGEPVRRVLELVDAACTAHFDGEARTAGRRLLARIAAGDPAVFRRKAAPEPAAAAICWAVGKGNDLFNSWGGGFQVKELAAFFGLSSCSQRAGVLLRAAGIRHRAYEPTSVLDSVDLLVSGRRADLISQRDLFRDRIAQG